MMTATFSSLPRVAGRVQELAEGELDAASALRVEPLERRRNCFQKGLHRDELSQSEFAVPPRVKCSAQRAEGRHFHPSEP